MIIQASLLRWSKRILVTRLNAWPFFLKRRLWKEHVKIATQNSLACKHLEQFRRNVIEAGLEKQSLFPSSFETDLETTIGHLTTLRNGDPLPSSIASDALQIDRELRHVYEEVLKGRTAFAHHFGNASNRLLPFDQMFTPNEGWPIFLDHYPRQIS